MTSKLACYASVAVVLASRTALADTDDPPPPKPIIVTQARPVPSGTAPEGPWVPPETATKNLRTRPGLYGPGIAVTTIGALILVGSIPFIASGSGSSSGNIGAGLGDILLGVGIVHLAVGIPLIAVGLTPHEVPATATSPSPAAWLAPPPSASGRQLSMTWRF